MSNSGRISPENGRDWTTAILESLSEGVVTMDRNRIITSMNRAAEEITGTPRDEGVGRPCFEVLRSSLCEEGCPVAETLEKDRPVLDRRAFLVDSLGNRIAVRLSANVLRDADGRVLGAVETIRDVSELEALRSELQGRRRVGRLVSRSPTMRQLFEMLPKVARSPATVLIQGETGTGKELVARAIHDLSSRSDGPFVAVNCGALPDTLLEAELFGYKAGAFTGAVHDRVGRFAAAKGGTLFLDEVGEMSEALQVRLLRVLQERRFEPLGANQSQELDARILAATNKDLAEEVAAGRFREDLFYRLNVVRLALPPLRERKEDIPLLVEEFVDSFNRLYGRRIVGVTRDVLDALMAHDWPGNVRELENVIERAFAICADDIIDVEHLPEDLRGAVGTGGLLAGGDDASGRAGLRDVKERTEAMAIVEALERAGYNRTKAAEILGIHKATLFRKMKRLGIEVPSSRRKK